MTEPVNEATKVIAEAMEDPEATNPAELLAKLMSANFRDYSNTSSMLIEGYQKQITDLEAELGAIRRGINRLFAKGYMPTESAIMQAVFYPSDQEQRRRLGFRDEDEDE